MLALSLLCEQNEKARADAATKYMSQLTSNSCDILDLIGDEKIVQFLHY
jgi:hypothetical protein